MKKCYAEQKIQNLSHSNFDDIFQISQSFSKRKCNITQEKIEC